MERQQGNCSSGSKLGCNTRNTTNVMPYFFNHRLHGYTQIIKLRGLDYFCHLKSVMLQIVGRERTRQHGRTCCLSAATYKRGGSKRSALLIRSVYISVICGLKILSAKSL